MNRVQTTALCSIELLIRRTAYNIRKRTFSNLDFILVSRCLILWLLSIMRYVIISDV